MAVGTSDGDYHEDHVDFQLKNMGVPDKFEDKRDSFAEAVADSKKTNVDRTSKGDRAGDKPVTQAPAGVISRDFEQLTMAGASTGEAFGPDSIAHGMPPGASEKPAGAFSEVPRYHPAGDKQTLSVGDFLGSWLGIKPNPPTKTIEQNPPSKEYPSDADVAFSKEVQRGYADPSESYFTGGKAINELTVNNVLDWFNKGEKANPKIGPMSQEEADEVHRNWIAAERSAVAKLGFSPGRMYSTPNANLTIGGAYIKNKDEIWYDRSLKSVPIHESLHRGMNILRKEGLLPDTGLIEEYAVRGLMARHFGDIEAGHGEMSKQQMEIGKKIDPAKLDLIEKAAADYIAKKRPGGPR